MRAPLLAAFALAFALAGCASSRVSITGEIKYGKTAEENYQAGVEELKGENWLAAQKFFEHVRTKYPFSKYSALAELRLADARFNQDRFLEAAEAYATWAQLHPTHEEVDYAVLRAAVSRVRDAPAEFVLFPPAFEKDQRSLKQGVEQLQAFLRQYPDSKYAPDAKKLLDQAQGRLAAHEWYVAEFYWKRERWAGAAGRLEGILKDFPGSPREAEALYMLARAYLKLDERFRAQQALQRLVARHPEFPQRAEAEALLASLR